MKILKTTTCLVLLCSPVFAQGVPGAPAVAAPAADAQPAADEVPALPDADISGHKDQVKDLNAKQLDLLNNNLDVSNMEAQARLADATLKHEESVRKLELLKKTGFETPPPPPPAAAGLGAPGTQQASAYPAPPPPPVEKMVKDPPVMPKLSSVWGFTGAYHANVLVPYQGAEMDMTAGKTLRNGMQIVSISLTSAVLKDTDGHRFTIGMGTSVPLVRQEHKEMVQAVPSAFQPLPGMSNLPTMPAMPMGMPGMAQAAPAPMAGQAYNPAQYSSPLPAQLTSVTPNSLPTTLQPIGIPSPTLSPGNGIGNLPSLGGLPR